MQRLAALAATVALFPVPLSAQHRLDPSRLQPITAPVRDAGVLDVSTGRWTRPGQAARKAGGVQTIYNNTCSLVGSAYYAGFEACETLYDEGRVPSTSDPNAPLGAEDTNRMRSFQVSYCTWVGPVAATGGYELEVAFWNNLAAGCNGGTAPTPPPISTQAAAYFDLAGMGLPGSTASGFQACWIVTIDVSNSGWVMASDGDGKFDNDPTVDGFTWSIRQNNAATLSQTNPDGFLIAGDPLIAPFGSCSYTIPCGVNPFTGSSCGTGLDTLDTSWINVDGIGVGSSAVPANCPGSVAQYGFGTNCYFFGGYPTNPFASYYLVLEAERGPAGAASYCTAQAETSCGEVAVTAGPSASTSQAASGPGSFDVTCGPVPGGPSPAIVTYNATTPSGPATLSSFGLTCVSQGQGYFLVGPRTFAAGGCASAYTFDFGGYLATQSVDPRITAAGLAANGPATCRLQPLFRDPAAPGTARLGSAIEFEITP